MTSAPYFTFLPDELANRVDAVGDAGRVLDLDVGREAGEVAVAAGARDGERRRDHPRTWNVAAIDGALERDVEILRRSRRRESS